MKPKQNTDQKTQAIQELLRPSQKPERKAARAEAEFELQCACHLYVQMQYPNFYSFHIANERKTKTYGKNKASIEGGKLKKAGVKKGNPDYWILEAFEIDGKQFVGTVIELKAKGKLNTTSPEQQQCLRDLSDRNYFTDVVDNIEDFISIVDKHYLKHKKPKWKI